MPLVQRLRAGLAYFATPRLELKRFVPLGFQEPSSRAEVKPRLMGRRVTDAGTAVPPAVLAFSSS